MPFWARFVLPGDVFVEIELQSHPVPKSAPRRDLWRKGTAQYRPGQRCRRTSKPPASQPAPSAEPKLPAGTHRHHRPLRRHDGHSRHPATGMAPTVQWWPRVRVAVVWPIRKGPFRHGRNSQSRVGPRVGRHGRTVHDVQARARIDPVKPVDHAVAGRCANHATTKEMRRHRHPEYLPPGPTRIPGHSTGQPSHDLVAHRQPRRVGLAVPRPAHEPRPPEEASLARYGQRIVVSLHYQSNNGAFRPGAQVESSQ